MVKKRSLFGRIYILLICLLMYAPLFLLVVCSFNASKQRSIWGGFTLHWYRDMFRDEEVIRAVATSMTLTTGAALTAAIIGTMVALAMTVLKKHTKAMVSLTSNIPLLNADIVTGISIMLLFSNTYSHRYAVGYPSGFGGLPAPPS